MRGSVWKESHTEKRKILNEKDNGSFENLKNTQKRTVWQRDLWKMLSYMQIHLLDYFRNKMVEILNSKDDRVLIQTSDWKKWRVRRKDLEKYFNQLFKE